MRGIDVEALGEKFKTVIDVYQLLDNNTKKNELLLAIFDEIKFEILGKQGRHNRFNLNVTPSVIFLGL